MASNSVTHSKFVIKYIVSNDDNVMTVNLCYPNPGNKADKGKLPKWVYDPTFMADLGHHKKSVAKYFYTLAIVKVSISSGSKLPCP